MIALSAAVATATVVVSVVGVLEPSLVPSVPATGLPATKVLLVIGACSSSASGRARPTFLLMHRDGDLSGCSARDARRGALAALMLLLTYLGWWIGHAFELDGHQRCSAHRRRTTFAAAVARARSRAHCVPATSFRPRRRFWERGCARSCSSRREDVYRRSTRAAFAALAVDVGERLGLSPRGCASLRPEGRCTTLGSFSIPDRSCATSGPLDDDEYAEIKLHPGGP